MLVLDPRAGSPPGRPPRAARRRDRRSPPGRRAGHGRAGPGARALSRRGATWPACCPGTSPRPAAAPRDRCASSTARALALPTTYGDLVADPRAEPAVLRTADGTRGGGPAGRPAGARGGRGRSGGGDGHGRGGGGRSGPVPGRARACRRAPAGGGRRGRARRPARAVPAAGGGGRGGARRGTGGGVGRGRGRAAAAPVLARRRRLPVDVPGPSAVPAAHPAGGRPRAATRRDHRCARGCSACWPRSPTRSPATARRCAWLADRARCCCWSRSSWTASTVRWRATPAPSPRSAGGSTCGSDRLKEYAVYAGLAAGARPSAWGLAAAAFAVLVVRHFVDFGYAARPPGPRTAPAAARLRVRSPPGPRGRPERPALMWAKRAVIMPVGERTIAARRAGSDRRRRAGPSACCWPPAAWPPCTRSAGPGRPHAGRRGGWAGSGPGRARAVEQGGWPPLVGLAPPGRAARRRTCCWPPSRCHQYDVVYRQRLTGVAAADAEPGWLGRVPWPVRVAVVVLLTLLLSSAALTAVLAGAGAVLLVAAGVDSLRWWRAFVRSGPVSARVPGAAVGCDDAARGGPARVDDVAGATPSTGWPGCCCARSRCGSPASSCARRSRPTS